jgi:hypothetical protein
MSNVYQKGDLVRIGPAEGETLFTDIAGNPIDPTGVSLFVTDPTGETTEYVYGTDAELVNTTPGNYHVEVSVDSAGRWFWKWASSDVGQAAEHGEFMVEPSAFVVEVP